MRIRDVTPKDAKLSVEVQKTKMNVLDYLEVWGTVTNKGAEKITSVKVTLAAYTRSNDLLDRDYTYCDSDEIAPGKESDFHIYLSDVDGVMPARLECKAAGRAQGEGFFSFLEDKPEPKRSKENERDDSDDFQVFQAESRVVRSKPTVRVTKREAVAVVYLKSGEKFLPDVMSYSRGNLMMWIGDDFKKVTIDEVKSFEMHGAEESTTEE